MDEKKSYLAGAGIAILFGTSFLASKTALSVFVQPAILAWRFTVAACILWILAIFHVIRIDLKGKPWYRLLGISVVYPLLSYTLETKGLTMIPSSQAGVIVSLMPVIAMIMGAIFLKENRKILQKILEMLLLVIGFTVCTMLYFSKRIAKPLVEVAQTLEKAPNGMAVLEEPRGSFKEMSKFVSCYNQAGKKIEELLEKVERESRLKEKAHYEMLMSQISPHFIFNTVNSIRIMAIKEGQDRAGGNENTEKALEALGDILHAVYSNKNGMTTVGQETALLKAYVDIMQMRFGSSFQYYNVIPTELFYYEIPAFTMQPIVENAILHGVKGVTAGQIIVSAIEYENDFVISVFNNGNSADKKKIEDLLKGEKNQRAVTGIGLYNVNSRLKLLYGESYGLIYNEKVRNGFEIWVRLPKKITESEER